jgi:hypothetical protein
MFKRARFADASYPVRWFQHTNRPDALIKRLNRAGGANAPPLARTVNVVAAVFSQAAPPPRLPVFMGGRHTSGPRRRLQPTGWGVVRSTHPALRPSAGTKGGRPGLFRAAALELLVAAGAHQLLEDG